MGARTTKMKPQGRVGQTSYTNMHKANVGSRLSIFDTGPSAWVRPHPNELTRTPSYDLPKRFYMGTRTIATKRQGKAVQTSCMNVHKANLGSQLIIFYMGSFARARPHPNNPLKRVDTDTLKRPTRTISHGCLHNRNEATRENRANELHEHAQSQPRVTT